MRKIRPPEQVLKSFGREWAIQHDYSRYANGKFRAKHGTIFKDAAEIGFHLVNAGIIKKSGETYKLMEVG